MFEAGRIGGYIALLRKQRGMTQNKLAERMAVSHQAVSNWERGETMPDISILVQLCSELHVSTDQLLRAGTMPEEEKEEKGEFRLDGPAERIGRYMQDRQPERIRKRAFGIGEEERPTPEVPSQPEQSSSSLKGGVSWEKVVSLAPFLSREMLNALAEDIDEKADYKRLEDMAPFLSRETLDSFVQRLMAEGSEASWGVVENLAPFLSRPTLDKLVKMIDEKADYKRLEDMAPFLSRETLDSFVQRLMAEGSEASWGVVENLAPFLPRPTLDKLVKKLWENGAVE